MGRTILVASDGTPAALGALRFARAISHQEGCEVEVMGVIEPMPVFDAGFMVAFPESEVYESRAEALREQLAQQVELVKPFGNPWTVTVQAGVPGRKIVNRAEKLGADPLLMGLGRHGPMDRVFGTETALQFLRISHIPILAVPADFSELPRSAVMGVDFSLFSERAAKAAIGLLAPPWNVHLIHVMSGMEFLPTLSEEWRGDYEAEVMERLQEFSEKLTPPEGSAVHSHIREGEPAHELLSFAEGRGMDLMVAGSHGHSFVGRLLMGSVSTRLIRGSRVPVLVVPPVEPSEEVLAEKATVPDEGAWVRSLRTFTRTHAGKPCDLEMEDGEGGHQECGRNSPFSSVDYDPRKDRINIVLGPSGSVEGHLTYSLPSPQAVRIEEEGDGGRQSLRVEFRSGKAILRILEG